MKRKFFSSAAILAIILILATSTVLAAPAAGRAGHGLVDGLTPGQFQTFEQKIPVQIIFLGYGPKQVNKNTVLDQLPATYEPLVRYPQFYGLPGRDMGLKFKFDYKVTYADRLLTNAFFSYLKKIGTPGDPTVFQTDYNDQETNVLDVTGPVLYIDAPSVETWLAKWLPNTNPRGYTIVYVNWYGRKDFKFHVYTKTDVADPDTGYNFGEVRASRKTIAWGGTTSRMWFYDLSAGPESWSGNYIVDFKDLDGNGAEDYRMPPIWEYAANGYRDPAALSRDLGLVARFVGINLLFTTSPLYDPLVTAPGPKGNKIVDINMFEDDPASLGTDWINTDYVRRELRGFQPYYDWRVRLTDYNPIDPGAKMSLGIFGETALVDDCWNDFGTPFAQLFCYFDRNRDAYLPPYKPNDYVAGIYAFNTTDENLGTQSGLLGFADDNWIDGTQSYVFAFDSEYYRSIGYGFSTTTVHETGHHIGMSHPHDGYDSELGLDYGPSDDFYFAWSGDESNTIMHYMDLSDEFGRFDRDNMYRWEFAGFMNWSNDLLGLIQADPHSWQVRRFVDDAKWNATLAVQYFKGWEYQKAAAAAYRSYVVLKLAADRLGIEDPTLMEARMFMGGTAPHEGDPIRFPDN